MKHLTCLFVICALGVSSCVGEYPAYQYVEIEWVTIEGGDFIMGSENGDLNEGPRHTVSVPTFQIMKTEVTVEMYQVCVNAGECSDSGGQNKSHPAVLNWYQLNEFAAYVGGRLPTEAEWEYAARSGGREITYPWGDESPTCTLAQKDVCDGKTGLTVPVCSKPAGHTDQGLCDMAGNVWEWVQDEYHESYDGAPSDGRGWCASDCPENASDPRYNASDSTPRVLRGGSWPGAVRTANLRAAARSYNDPSRRSDYVGNGYRDGGGRVARSIP
jgi:formylglycine-generating enzyme required for sulfatase activity